jgi:hypothetical protein
VGFGGRLRLAQLVGDDQLVRRDAGFGDGQDTGGRVLMLGLVEVRRDQAVGERESIAQEDAEEVSFRVDGGG